MPRTERTIVITQAGRGFGAVAVRAFADRGDRVWGTMRNVVGRNAGKKAALEGDYPRIPNAEMHAFTQPRHDALLKEMQRDSVLDGADACRAYP